MAEIRRRNRILVRAPFIRPAKRIPVARQRAPLRLRLTHIAQSRERDGGYRITFATLNPRTGERKTHSLNPKTLNPKQLQMLRQHYEAYTKHQAKGNWVKGGIAAAFTDPHTIATVVKFLLAA